MLPATPTVTHHVLVFSVTGPPSSANATGAPDTTSIFVRGFPTMLTEFARGNDGDIFSDNESKLVKKDATIRFQIHYHPNGKTAVKGDQVKVGIKFFPKGYQPKHVVQTMALASPTTLAIAPGDPNSRSDSYFTLQQPARLVSYQPHMHYRGKRMVLEAILPKKAPDKKPRRALISTWRNTYNGIPNDPTNKKLEDEVTGSILVKAADRDRRWVRVRRPVVTVGGELTLEMLDLTFNPLSKLHEAPIQLKANGGVLLVDDFGRQRIRPQDLLNRWIVPLESRVDYLTLHTGKKFQVPFDVLIVFATNLKPASLADEAFLRRIPYKIAVGDPSLDEFSRIFEMNCRRRNLRFHQVMVAYLQRRHYGPARRPFRACHPRDLLDQVTALCRYRGIEPAITRELLDAACSSYFVDEEPGAAPVAARARKAAPQHLEVH